MKKKKKRTHFYEDNDLTNKVNTTKLLLKEATQHKHTWWLLMPSSFWYRTVIYIFQCSQKDMHLAGTEKCQVKSRYFEICYFNVSTVLSTVTIFKTSL